MHQYTAVAQRLTRAPGTGSSFVAPWRAPRAPRLPFSPCPIELSTLMTPRALIPPYAPFGMLTSSASLPYSPSAILRLGGTSV